MDLTTNGKDMLKSFLFSVSGFSGLYTLADREAECIKYIKDTVGDKKVLVSMRSSDASIVMFLDLIRPLLSSIEFIERRSRFDRLYCPSSQGSKQRSSDSYSY